MPSGVDLEGLNSPEVQKLRAVETPEDLPFKVTKLGHVVLMVEDLQRALRFYTQVLGFKVSDVYPASMVPGGMVFMRFNEDHHGVALVGGRKESRGQRDMHHMAFAVATLDEVLAARAHLEHHGVTVDFHGRRRAGCQVAVEFRDPDGHRLEIYWGLDQVPSNGESRPPEEWAEEHSLEAAVDNAPPGQDTTLADPSLRRD